VSFVRAFALATALAIAGCASSAPPRVDLPRRIVSLMPSLTEDLFAIGAGPMVVGVSQYTDYPKAATALPIVASFASADVERIVRLRPDVVVGIPSQSAPAAEVRKSGIRTVLLNDDAFDDIFGDIEALGLLTGRDDAAHALTDRLRGRTTALMRTVLKRSRPLRAFVVLGTAPIFTVGSGSYVAKLLELAGGVNAAHMARIAPNR
jgi:ABC-type Fe3+-hydroxamate transport system substrate-binding protein